MPVEGSTGGAREEKKVYRGPLSLGVKGPGEGCPGEEDSCKDELRTRGGGRRWQSWAVA